MAELESNTNNLRRRRIRVTVLTAVTGFLFVLLLVLQAFDTLRFLRPDTASQALIFIALSTFNFTAFIVLLMVLGRNIIKLRREQQSGKLGARFRQRLVIFFIALSFLPVMFLFFAMTGYINRSIDKWFSLPSEEILTTASYIESNFLDHEGTELEQLAYTLSRALVQAPAEQRESVVTAEANTHNLLIAQLMDANGQPLQPRYTRRAESEFTAQFKAAWQQVQAQAKAGASSHAEVSEQRGDGNVITLLAGVPVAGQRIFLLAQEIATPYTANIERIRAAQKNYEELKQRRRLYRRSSLQTLFLIALLVLFIAYWLANYVARTISDPVQQLAQATNRIRAGDLDYRAIIVGDDELATLARSFNEMTGELSENRKRLEERRRYIETILQSLSAGVISLDENNNVTTINPAAQRMLRLSEDVATGIALATLLPEDQREELGRMIRRAERLGSVTREVHFTLANHTPLDAAVTVSVLHDPQGHTRGAVIVLEDLSDLIEAQRRSAWSEVARRMAHEIKNPLTPIRLSAERLVKNLLGVSSNGAAANAANGPNLTERQTQLIRECTSLISSEVTTLQRMVDEFSTYARLPNAKLELASLNAVITDAAKLYQERLNGAQIELRLAEDLPAVMIDAEQIKRVMVNLIDNALEAMSAQRTLRKITIETRENAARETVELIVSDTGPGIPESDRERVFDPYYSTSKRGTGLGLAIVSHTIIEHQGRIRLNANLPQGARFTIELPLNV